MDTRQIVHHLRGWSARLRTTNILATMVVMENIAREMDEVADALEREAASTRQFRVTEERCPGHIADELPGGLGYQCALPKGHEGPHQKDALVRERRGPGWGR